jgi:hypothetical protein
MKAWQFGHCHRPNQQSRRDENGWKRDKTEWQFGQRGLAIVKNRRAMAAMPPKSPTLELGINKNIIINIITKHILIFKTDDVFIFIPIH